MTFLRRWRRGGRASTTTAAEQKSTEIGQARPVDDRVDDRVDVDEPPAGVVHLKPPGLEGDETAIGIDEEGEFRLGMNEQETCAHRGPTRHVGRNDQCERAQDVLILLDPSQIGVGGETGSGRGGGESDVDDDVEDAANADSREDQDGLDEEEEEVVLVEVGAELDREDSKPDGDADGDAARRGDDTLAVERAESDDDEPVEGHGQGTQDTCHHGGSENPGQVGCLQQKMVETDIKDHTKYSLYQKKMVQSENFFFYMKFVPTVCVFDIISKRNKCSFCCYLNYIFCFCKSRVMSRFMR